MRSGRQEFAPERRRKRFCNKVARCTATWDNPSGGFFNRLRPQHLKRVRRTGLFAQAASHTGLGFVKAGDGLPINVKHGERLEGTHRHADFAADTILFPDVRLWPVSSFNSGGLVALGVADGAVRTPPGAHTAFNASGDIDAVWLFLLSIRGTSGAGSCACLAPFALFRDYYIGHGRRSLHTNASILIVRNFKRFPRMGTSQITSNNCGLSRWLKEPFLKKLGQRAGEVNVNNKNRLPWFHESLSCFLIHLLRHVIRPEKSA